MVFQQGHRKPGDEAYPLGYVAGRRTTENASWKPFSTSCYSTVTLFAKFLG